MRRALLVLLFAGLVCTVGFGADGVTLEDTTTASDLYPVNPGQRFLAQTIRVRNTTDDAIWLSHLDLSNYYASDEAINGTDISRVEVRRVGVNDPLYDDGWDATEPLDLCDNNAPQRRVAAGSTAQLEIWITLAANSQMGGKWLVLNSIVGYRFDNEELDEEKRTQERPSKRRVQAQLIARNDGTLQGGYVHEGAVVVAQRILLRNHSTETVEISELTVSNVSSPSADRVRGQHVSMIEVFRGTTRLGFENIASQLVGFHDDDGARILTTGFEIPAGQSREIEVRVTLLPEQVNRGRYIRLSTDLTYVRPAGYTEVNIGHPTLRPGNADNTPVSSSPLFQVEDLRIEDKNVPSATVYPGQRFLAQRIEIHNSRHGTDVNLDTLLLRNAEPPPPTGDGLHGRFISRIEVVRASDRASVGNVTNATHLGLLTTTGVTVETRANRTVPAYRRVELEVWVTLRDDAPPGHLLKLEAQAGYTPKDGSPVGTNPDDTHPWHRAEEIHGWFTIGGPGELHDIDNLTVDGPSNVFAGQRFMAQRIALVSWDPDPYDVTVTSLIVHNRVQPNKSDDRLADNQIARIQIIRARDGALMGQTTNPTGLSTGGVRIPTTTNNIVRDDTTEVVEVWITLNDNIPDDRSLWIQSEVWYRSGGEDLSGWAEPWSASRAFITGVGEHERGFEEARTLTVRSSSVFPGRPFLAQRILLVDKDIDPYDVVIESLTIRNAAPTERRPLADQHVAKIAIIRSEDRAVLAEAANVQGFSHQGARIPTTQHNVVPDDTSVELEIWITLTEDAPEGRQIRLETVVWHREGATSFHDEKIPTDRLVGPAEFTSTGKWDAKAPEAAFSYTPNEDLTYRSTIIFDPSASKHPDNLELVEFIWDFGDGTELEMTTPRKVTHRYEWGGEYVVMLTVIDVLGQNDIAMKPIKVEARPPDVEIDITASTPVAGKPVTLTAKVESPHEPFTFDWDFGDGTTKKDTRQKTVQHTYKEPDTYTVEVTVTDRYGKKTTVTREITVREDLAPLSVGFSWSPDDPGMGQSIAFTAEVEDTNVPKQTPYTYKWRFGDGKTSEEANPTHAYDEPGIYDVELFLTGDREGSAYHTAKVTVLDHRAPIIEELDWSPEQPGAGERVTFTADVVDLDEPPDLPFAYTWHFGDDKTAEGTTEDGKISVTHTYAEAGTYTVRLEVRDARDASTSKEAEITVVQLQPPRVTAIEADPIAPEAGQEVALTAVTTAPDGDPAVEWEWDLDNGTTKTTTDTLRHTFTTPGVRTVRVRARNEIGGWGSRYSIDLYIRVRGGAEIGTQLAQNPVRDEARISVFLPVPGTTSSLSPMATGNADIKIFDMLGRLVHETQVTGSEVRWDLLDQRRGTIVPSGVYFFVVTATVDGREVRSDIGRIMVVR